MIVVRSRNVKLQAASMSFEKMRRSAVQVSFGAVDVLVHFDELRFGDVV